MEFFGLRGGLGEGWAADAGAGYGEETGLFERALLMRV